MKALATPGDMMYGPLMPITRPRAIDPYLAALAAERQEYDKREAAADELERQLQAEREAIAAGRTKVAAAEESYRAFLAKKSPSPPTLELTAEKTGHVAKPKFVRPAEQIAGGDLDGVTLRVGPQRLRVLEVVAHATAQGKLVSNSEIASDTNISPARISNVLFEDGRRGFLERHGDKVRMTARGLEFLRLMQSPAVVPASNAKTPDNPEVVRRSDIGVEVERFPATTKTQH